MKSKLLYGNESPEEQARQAKRFAYLLEHHMDELLRIFPTPDTSDTGVQFVIDLAIAKQEGVGICPHGEIGPCRFCWVHP